jgi:hypothetical protein
MTRLGKARLFNATVTIVAVFAWFTGTNHCLLGLMKQPENRGVSMMSHCPDHSKKSGGLADGPSAMLACCQGLQSPNFELAKTKIASNPVLLAIRLFAICHLVLPEAPKNILSSAQYDTGPPSAGCFVETVLRRSLRENAPPLLS